MKSYAFYVSGNATRILKFLNLYRNHNIINRFEFILIDNIKNKRIRSICKSLGINLYEVDLEKKQNKNVYISNLFLNLLQKHKVQFAFIFSNKILVGKILDNYKNKLINFHPSILPSHKGLNAIDKAIDSNTFLLGNSAHLVTSEVDCGQVIMQNIIPSHVFNGYDQILDKQIIMLFQIIKWINNNRLIISENKIYIKDASYMVSEFIPNIEFDNDTLTFPLKKEP